jgi:hypothetical protein
VGPKACVIHDSSFDCAAAAVANTSTVSPDGSLRAATTSVPPLAWFTACTISLYVRFCSSGGSSLEKIVISRSIRGRIGFEEAVDGCDESVDREGRDRAATEA